MQSDFSFDKRIALSYERQRAHPSAFSAAIGKAIDAIAGRVRVCLKSAARLAAIARRDDNGSWMLPTAMFESLLAEFGHVAAIT